MRRRYSFLRTPYEPGRSVRCLGRYRPVKNATRISPVQSPQNAGGSCQLRMASLEHKVSVIMMDPMVTAPARRALRRLIRAGETEGLDPAWCARVAFGGRLAVPRICVRSRSGMPRSRHRRLACRSFAGVGRGWVPALYSRPRSFFYLWSKVGRRSQRRAKDPDRHARKNPVRPNHSLKNGAAR
jgi:hypothetical protein